MQDFYILVLSIVFKETQYFVLMEHPQNWKKKKNFGYLGSSIHGRVMATVFI